MRLLSGSIVFVVLVLTVAGCGSGKNFDGPTVDAFVGRLTQNGKPVSFPEGQEVTLRVIYQPKAQRFGIPIQPDGSFKIGWMPIGKYSAVLEIKKEMRPTMYNVPGGLTIEEGKTEYTIELGDGWKP